MISLNTYLIQNTHKLKYYLATGLVSLIATNIFIDYLFSQFQGSAFYLSESLLFSSFWLLFFPLLPVLFKLSQTTKPAYKLVFTAFVISIHLIAYPALVWLLSKAFYGHTFSYWQTFNFGISAYLIKSVIIYFFLLTIFSVSTYIKQRAVESVESVESKIEQRQNFITSIIVSDNHNKKIVLATHDIYSFSSNTPYIEVNHLTKKYLYHKTLKSLEQELNSNQFVRVHKSSIVNIYQIIAFKSRQNGDYDLELSDKTTLRASRNYVKNLMIKLQACNRLTAK